jgi:hypothetical protein
MATMRQHRRTIKAIIQYINSYEVSGVSDIDIVFTLHIIEEWHRMWSIHSTNWQIQKGRASTADRCLRAEKYPQRQHPNCRTFISLGCCMRKTSCILSNTIAGRLWSRTGADVKDVSHPLSTRKIPGTYFC